MPQARGGERNRLFDSLTRAERSVGQIPDFEQVSAALVEILPEIHALGG